MSTRHGRLDLGILAAILLFAATLLGFALISDVVVEGETHAFDRAVLLQLRTAGDPDNPIGPKWVEVAAGDITSLGGITVLSLVALAVAGYLLIDRRYASTLLVFVSVGGGMLLNMGLKAGFDRPRPDIVVHAVEVHTLSFPSAHAMLSAVTYLTLGTLLAQTRLHRRQSVYVLAIAVLLTLLIGVSRVYLGVHWPTDVLAGWCVGAAWAMGCWLVIGWQQRSAGTARPGETLPRSADLDARVKDD
ncbi:phosphatase PAP2 family protein [Defluviicoccus vanus]|uniref:phosphatase PAP2 family protein n=1 Tax=Defluviicoccus vanus TaxID=111831 RepID=UPI001CBA6A02|nr:phosphatase PAP2 family protein [Defluviicoccus vanus]